MAALSISPACQNPKSNQNPGQSKIWFTFGHDLIYRRLSPAFAAGNVNQDLRQRRIWFTFGHNFIHRRLSPRQGAALFAIHFCDKRAGVVAISEGHSQTFFYAMLQLQLLPTARQHTSDPLDDSLPVPSSSAPQIYEGRFALWL